MTMNAGNHCKACKLPEPIFNRLWEAMKALLKHEPDGSPGVIGPGLKLLSPRAEAYTAWIRAILDNGVGAQYWGAEVELQWTSDTDRATIMKAFRDLMIRMANIERGRRASWMKKINKVKAGTDGDVDDDVPVEMDIEYAIVELFPPADTTHQSQSQETVVTSPSTPPKKRLLKQPRTPALLKRPKLTPKERRNILLTSLDPDVAPYTFHTRLGDDPAINLVFAPLSVTFTVFFDLFCKAWRQDPEQFCEEAVEVRVHIPESRDYGLPTGIFRDGGWSRLMAEVDVYGTVVTIK